MEMKTLTYHICISREEYFQENVYRCGHQCPAPGTQRFKFPWICTPQSSCLLTKAGKLITLSFLGKE